MSNIRTSPTRPLTTCCKKRNLDWSFSLPPKHGSRKEASPAVSSSVTETAADHSHHSRLSILRKFVERGSGDLMLPTGAPSALASLIDDHRPKCASCSGTSL